MTESDSARTPGQADLPFRYVHTSGLPALLEGLGASLQDGLIVPIGSASPVR